MDRGCFDAGSTELFHEPFGTEARRRRAWSGRAGGWRSCSTEALDSAGALPAILDVGLLGVADEIVAHRLVLVAAHELVDITVESGGEEHRLALLRHHVEQLHDLGQEAQIGHAVGLVDHGDLGAVERHGALLDEIEQSTRAGDDQRRAAFGEHQLGAVGHPASTARM